MKRLIVFDMDGTLYDLSDVMSTVYETQVSFLCERMGWAKEKAIQLLRENDVEPHVTKNSKSATELFMRLGFGRKEWAEYRQKHFPVEKIDPAKAAEPVLIERFAKFGDIVLLTSNTSNVCGCILARIRMVENPFMKIVCSDTTGEETPFDKYHEMKKLMDAHTYDSLISIGDRYQTDIVPALKLGVCGCLVSGCDSLGKVYEDLASDHLCSCSEYEYFQSEE